MRLHNVSFYAFSVFKQRLSSSHIMQQERDTTFHSLTVEKREKGKERVCAVCLEPLDDHSLSLEEIVAMMLKREQKSGEEEAKRLLCCDEEEMRQAEEEEKNTVCRGYSFVGSGLACREKHLLCGECVLEFAADPTNLSCPCCRSPLAPLFTLLHLLQVEKARANFMCSQQQAIRNLVDEFVERKLTQLQQRREGEEEEAQGEIREGRGGGGKRKRPRLQAEEDRNCCGRRVIAIDAACSWGNEFTEEIRYRTRAPDAREMLCMLRLKH